MLNKPYLNDLFEGIIILNEDERVSLLPQYKELTLSDCYKLYPIEDIASFLKTSSTANRINIHYARNDDEVEKILLSALCEYQVYQHVNLVIKNNDLYSMFFSEDLYHIYNVKQKVLKRHPYSITPTYVDCSSILGKDESMMRLSLKLSRCSGIPDSIRGVVGSDYMGTVYFYRKLDADE